MYCYVVWYHFLGERHSAASIYYIELGSCEVKVSSTALQNVTSEDTILIVTAVR